MSQWQVLRCSRASRAPLGYNLHHAAGVSVHYSTAAAAPAALDGGRSFCLSRDKHTLQQLNGRLASYLQQVQCLAAANQRLERQIQEELDRKCPGELKELDGHLRSVSLLQDQIRECLSAQAQVKLQMLNAELTVLDLKMRSEQEREQRSRVELELSDLRLLKEELRVNQLPELQSLLNDQTQQLVELHQQHQQDTKVLLGQVSGGVAVQMQSAKSSDLIQQLDCLRQTSVTLLDKNQNGSWFSTQVSRLSSPEVTFDALVESEVDQAELGELRRTAARLTEELMQQQMLITHLEVYGQEQTESFVLKLRVLQETVDSLSRDLDSVLQATAKQAADHQTLLDVKNQLEAEIEDYRGLLDAMTHQGVLCSPYIQSSPAATPACVLSSPYTSRKNNTADTVSVKGGNLRKVEVQTASRGHVRTVGQTPAGAPLSETVTTVQSIRVHSNHQNNSALAERAEQESMTINHQGILMEDRVPAKDLQVSPMVDSQILQASDSRIAVNASKTEIISPTLPDSSSAIQTEPETSTLKTTTDTNLQAKTIPGAEPDVKQEPHLETVADPGKPTAAEVFTNAFNTETNNLTAIETEFKAENASPGLPEKTASTEIVKVEVEEVEVVHGNNKPETDNDSEIVASIIDPGVALGSSDPEELLSSRETEIPTSPTKPDTPEMCPAETADDLKIYRPNSDTCMGPVEINTLTDKTEIATVSVVCEAKVSDEHRELEEASKLPVSNPEDLSPQEAGELMHPTKEVKCLSPEKCMSPTETEVFLNMTDHVFCPVDPEENVKSPDLLDEPKMVLSPSDPDTCLSPAEVTECLCPNDEEEDEEAGLSLTEANAHVKPVEKYILSTKEEEGQSLSLSGDQGLSEKDRYTNITGDLYWKCSTDKCKDSGSMADDVEKNDSQVVNKPVDSNTVFGKPASSRCSNGEAAFSSAADKPEGILAGNAQAPTAGVQGRSTQGSGEWLVYGARVGRTGSSSPSPKATLPASSQPETGRFGSAGSGEWILYGGSLKRKSSLDGGTSLSCRKEDSSSSDSKLAASPSDTGRFKRRGSEEWMVYGSLGRKDNLTRSESLPNTESKEFQATDRKRTPSPPATGRFGSEGSGEWRVYGGSSGRLSTAGSTERVSGNRSRAFSPPGSYTSSGPRLCSAGSSERISGNRSRAFSPPGSYTSSGPRLCSAGSGGKLSSGSVVRRSSSVGSGGRLSSSGSGGRLSSSPGSYRISSTGRYSSTGSGEWKPVYSSASGRRSSVGSTGQHGGGRTTSSQRAPSPGGKMGVSGGSGGWLRSSAATGNRVSSAGSGNNLNTAGSNERISNRPGGRTSSSSGSGRTSSTGGRVISSCDRPAWSTGSGAGGNKERISVCKMAALSISAAGRERSQERQRQRSQHQQAAVMSPLVQRWLTTGVGVTSTDPEGLDDIMQL